MTDSESLKRSYSNAFYDFYKEYGLKRNECITSAQIVNLYYGWLIKWAPHLSANINVEESRGNKHFLKTMVKKFLKERLESTSESDSDSSNDGDETTSTDDASSQIEDSLISKTEETSESDSDN